MSENTVTTENTNDQSLSAIDAAISKVNARKAKKAAGEASSAPAGDAAPKAPKPQLTEEEKAAKLAAKAQERADAKVVRDAAREAKKVERLANRKPAHLVKVNRAGERLGTMSDATQLIFNEATANLSSADIAMLAAHLAFHNRLAATQRSLSAKLEVGQQVTIVGGDPRFIGKTGVITKSQRIRCYAQVDGFEKAQYFFSADCEPVEAQAATGT